MFILQLSPLASAPTEMVFVARAADACDLKLLIDRERDGDRFKPEGPLAAYRLPGLLTHHIMEVGTADQWAEMARKDYAERVDKLPLPNAAKFEPVSRGGMITANCWRESHADTMRGGALAFIRVFMCRVCKSAYLKTLTPAYAK
jgi:hypothetical protein